MSASTAVRQMPHSAELLSDGAGTEFRVWAQDRESVTVVFEDGRRPILLQAEGDGYFSGAAPQVGAGARYKYEVDGLDSYPDPASRFLPNGPHGFSEV